MRTSAIREIAAPQADPVRRVTVAVPPVHAVVLTAGCGRRMHPLSATVHKALLPIGDTTILERTLHGLRAAGVRAITLVTGHRAADIRAAVRACDAGAGVRFVHNERFDTANNVVSLACALEDIEPGCDVVLVECDLLLDAELLRCVCTERAGNVALVDHYAVGMDGTVVTHDNGVVTRFIPRQSQGSGFSYENTFKTLNVYRVDGELCTQTLLPKLRRHIHEGGGDAFYELVLGRVVGMPGQRIAAEVVTPGSWAEVDDPNDLGPARFSFEPERRDELLDRTLGGHWSYGVLDFAYMRNCHFPPATMVAALRHALPALLSGYGSRQSVVDEKLAWFVGCDPARIVALNGASQAYPLLGDRWADLRIAIPEPSFGEYRRVFPAARTYEDGPGVDAEQLDELAAEVDVLVVVNPNNPTGTTLSSEALLALADRHPRTRLLVDESFVAFSGEPSLIPQLERRPRDNVVVLTSLSKLLGVPGARIGHLYGCDLELVAELRGRLPIWSLNSLAEHILELLLKYRSELDRSIAQTIGDRAHLARALAAVAGVARVHPSGGNFLLVDLDGPCAAAAATRTRLLTDHRIEVKDVSDRFAELHPRLRIGVRTRPDNRRLIAALTDVLTHTVPASPAAL